MKPKVQQKKMRDQRGFKLLGDQGIERKNIKLFCL